MLRKIFEALDIGTVRVSQQRTVLGGPTRSSALNYKALFKFPHECPIDWCVETSGLPERPKKNHEPSFTLRLTFVSGRECLFLFYVHGRIGRWLVLVARTYCNSKEYAMTRAVHRLENW
jgi:hypothetical protein